VRGDASDFSWPGFRTGGLFGFGLVLGASLRDRILHLLAGFRHQLAGLLNGRITGANGGFQQRPQLRSHAGEKRGSQADQHAGNQFGGNQGDAHTHDSDGGGLRNDVVALHFFPEILQLGVFLSQIVNVAVGGLLVCGGLSYGVLIV
jgi:hypothetical protein